MKYFTGLRTSEVLRTMVFRTVPLGKKWLKTVETFHLDDFVIEVESRKVDGKFCFDGIRKGYRNDSEFGISQHPKYRYQGKAIPLSNAKIYFTDGFVIDDIGSEYDWLVESWDNLEPNIDRIVNINRRRKMKHF